MIMKKVLAFMVLLPLALCAQVRIAEPAPKMLEDFPYDSTTNYVKKEKVRCLIGQELHVLPLRDYNQRDGYRRIVKGNKEFPSFFTHIEYDNLLGKVLTCTDAFSHEKYGLTSYYLELKDNSNGDIYYYEFSEVKSNFYFLILGYKEKFEHDCCGKTFLFKGASLSFHDFNTGEKVVAEPKQKYVFREMIYNSKNNELGYLFTDEKSHLLCFDEFIVKNSLMAKDEYDKYVGIYGERAVNSCLEGGYFVGMPVTLLELSWGKPKEINSTSYNKQYVYNLSRGRIKCFYVEDGKVTGWN